MTGGLARQDNNAGVFGTSYGTKRPFDGKDFWLLKKINTFVFTMTSL
jgi:hypothetical protein